MKLTLCLTKHHTVRTCVGGVQIYLHAILHSTLNVAEWSASCPGPFMPGERDPCAHWQDAEWASESIWVLWRREIFPDLAGNRISVVQPVA